jgi:hypothetical protein
MAVANLRRTVLQIVNEVQRKLGLTATTSLTQTKHATALLQWLNEVIDEVADSGRWQEMYAETSVSCSAGLGTYVVPGSAIVQNVEEIVYHTDISPLELRDPSDLRRLQRINSNGIPRQYALIGVCAGNPEFRVYPVPATAQASGRSFHIAYYVKPDMYTTSDGSVVPVFPANLLIQGLYAKALLDENGGEPSPQYQVAYQEYLRQRKEALNRYKADTGTDIRFVPTGGMY